MPKIKFPPDIEEELDYYDFSDSMITRQELGKLLLKQKDCQHDYHKVYDSFDNPTGIRCLKCSKQVWF